jgi:4-amino-4-deoxy-L-arabinose transferase-like glycosyltransferase
VIKKEALKNLLTPHYLKEPFQINNFYFWLTLFLFLVLRLLWAAYFPMANDEVYYWDWSRHIQLSYIDAPPFVSWISYLGGLLFQGSFGARFFLPFLHLFTTIFILLSSKIIAEINHKNFTNENALCALAIFQLAPVFNLEGIILLPDGSLLFAISGALYFILKAFLESKKSQNSLSIKYGLFFGIFLGIAALSKYHALPIAVGFFIASLILRGVKKSYHDFSFWFVTAIASIMVSSPVFIWNYLNHYASFHFQSQHGFSGFSFHYKPFLKYIFGSIFYLLPWFFIPLFYFSINGILKKSYYKSINLLTTIPFLILFTIILSSALGKQALPHWSMPGFLLLVPAFVLHWNPLTGKNRNTWIRFFKVTLFLSTVIPTILCIPKFNLLLIKGYTFVKGNADDLFQAYAWIDLQKDLLNQENIEIISTPYYETIENQNCLNHYQIGSLKWYWAAQLAFHFENKPRIYNFDFVNTSFYSWRDKLYDLANCKFIIIGSKDHFNKDDILKIMDIEETKEFHISPYNGENIIYIKGTMKDKLTLKEIYENKIKEVKY